MVCTHVYFIVTMVKQIMFEEKKRKRTMKGL